MNAEITNYAGKLIGQFVKVAWNSTAKNIPYIHSAKQKRDLIACYNEHRYKCEELRLICERDNLSFEHQKHQDIIEENRLAANLEADNRLNEIINSKELDFILKHLPIRVAPGIFKRTWNDFEQAPLHIFLAPPVGPTGEADMPRLLPEIERGIVRFCAEHYNPENLEQTPVKVMTRTWIQGKPCGQAGVDQLHDSLSGLPCVIIDTEAGLNEFSFNIACWGLPSENTKISVMLQPVGDIPYSAIALSSKSIPNNDIELENELKNETLIAVKRLLPFYKLLVATTADMFHLAQYGTQPRLPALMSTIFDNQIPDESLQQLVEKTLVSYRQAYAERAAALAPYSGEILLELAETLEKSGLLAQAEAQLNDAISCFCALRNVNIAVEDPPNKQLKALIDAIRSEDKNFLLRVESLWRKMNKIEIANNARDVINSYVTENERIQIGDFFDNGDGTITDISTRLMWKKCSEYQKWDSNTNTCVGTPSVLDWEFITKYLLDAEEMRLGEQVGIGQMLGRDDWRIPTFDELKSILDSTEDFPCINKKLFPRTLPYSYWSSSRQIDDPNLSKKAREEIVSRGKLYEQYKDHLKIIKFSDGVNTICPKKDGFNCVRLVRNVTKK